MKSNNKKKSFKKQKSKINKSNIEAIKKINKSRRKPKTIKKNEIRKNLLKEANYHPAYLMSIKGDKGKIVGLTHSPLTQGVKNIELRHNPNPEDVRKAYARPYIKDIPISKLSTNKYIGWKMSKENKKIVNKIKKAKKK
ncbi:MAG: hypothetical protein ACI4TX_05095 [Christensenellales bacterium]